MTVDTEEGSDTTYNFVGLPYGHSYALIGTVEFQVGEDPIKLYKIRNPWGSDNTYTGDFNDNDPFWTEYPELAEQANFTKANDGIFFIDHIDFMEVFETFTITVIEPTWKQNYHEIINDSG